MFMIRRIRGIVAIAGVVLAGAGVTPTTARAQAKFELTPFVGSYYPLAKVCTNCDSSGSNLNGRQVNAAAIGGRLTYWLSRTVGIEGSFGYTPSRIEVRIDSAGFGAASSAKGHVLLASGRLLFRPARTNLHFILGGGIVTRGGAAWTTAHTNKGTKLTSVGGVLGVGVHASVTPKFALEFSAEGNFYSFDPKFAPNPNSSNGSKLQSDLLISVGVPITLSR